MLLNLGKASGADPGHDVLFVLVDLLVVIVLLLDLGKGSGGEQGHDVVVVLLVFVANVVHLA